MASPTMHALLSASSSHRWLTCPPIARLEAEFPNPSSTFAEEGTAAHSLAELKLQYEAKLISKAVYTKRHKKFAETSDYYCEEMDEHTDNYVAQVLEIYNKYESATILLEQKVSFTEWVPEGFGTSDVVIASDKHLEICDLKYGKGVPVDAHHNPQLMLYALGTYAELADLYEFETVTMNILQPRLDNYSSYTISVEELLYWADNFVRPRALQAFAGEGEWNITDDVVRFSAVKGNLRARAEKNIDFVDKYELRESDLLQPEEISEILERSKEIKKWLEDVEYYALSQARDHGKKFPGWKLVEGRSNRIITNKDEAVNRLVEEGYLDIFKPQELLPMTALEKVVGKSTFSGLMDGLIDKPTGKPVLAPETDKRFEINSAAQAQADFDDFDENG